MRIVYKDGRRSAFLPTWRFLIVAAMYCVPVAQTSAWIIFAIEQKPMHPIGQICFGLAAIIALVLGSYVGKRDLRRIRNAGAVLEVTPHQLPMLILCMGGVPGSLLALVIASGI